MASRLLPDSILQLYKATRGIEYEERGKVVVTRAARVATPFFLVHLVAILGAVTILVLNLCGVWVGKELTGEIGEDGKKLFTLQLVAKVHELLMVASMSKLLWAAILRSLAHGGALPFAIFEAGTRLADVSMLWSKEFLALSLTEFRGKIPLVALMSASVLLGLVVGPASATGMSPAMTAWPVGTTPLPFNATHAQLWPEILNESSSSQLNDYLIRSDAINSHWTNVVDSFFNFWGQEVVGDIRSVPEFISIGSPSSVRTIDGRFRGPFSLYQPLVTAVTVQPVVMADQLNMLRLLWFRDNANQCTWAKLRVRITGNVCGYRDIHWTIPARQPVVYTACSATSNQSTLSFPTLGDDEGPLRVAAAFPNSTLDSRPGKWTLDWVDLRAEGAQTASIGAVLRSQDSGWYTCTVDAHWAEVTLKTSFLGTPFQVDGSPSDFFEPEAPGSRYRSERVAIDPDWASALALADSLGNGTESVVDKFLRAGRTDSISEGQVEAALAIAIAEQMAWVHANAALSIDTETTEPNWISVRQSLLEAASAAGDTLEFKTTVTGFAYGIRTAEGVSMSAVLSTVVLMLYVLLLGALLVMDVFSDCHVQSWSNVTDLIALALKSGCGQELRNCSSGVTSVKTMKLPVALVEANGAVSIEMVVGAQAATAGAAQRKLIVPGKVYE